MCVRVNGKIETLALYVRMCLKFLLKLYIYIYIYIYTLVKVAHASHGKKK